MAVERTIPAPAPTDLPSFTIRVDGADISREIHVASVTVTQMAGKIAAARIIVLDGDPATEDFPVSSGETFVPGGQIEILAGYHSLEEPIFTGIVVHGPQGRHGQHSREWVDPGTATLYAPDGPTAIAV